MIIKLTMEVLIFWKYLFEMPILKKIIIPNVKFWELNQFYVAPIFSITSHTFLLFRTD
jgi:hypothetical protein